MYETNKGAWGTADHVTLLRLFLLILFFSLFLFFLFFLYLLFFFFFLSLTTTRGLTLTTY